MNELMKNNQSGFATARHLLWLAVIPFAVIFVSWLLYFRAHPW